ncbi:hypothetical protein CGRA01v4_05682 [Colletotrichum graminicola]|nr:hypothetical protein CGRA01v4_05682 [Colletotrichum graminicola]
MSLVTHMQAHSRPVAALQQFFDLTKSPSPQKQSSVSRAPPSLRLSHPQRFPEGRFFYPEIGFPSAQLEAR